MKVGSLVLCMQQFPESIKRGFIAPNEGGIYTVRLIESDYPGETGILLEEIKNRNYNFIEGFCEPSFNIKAFREIQPPMDINIEDFIVEKQFL